MTQRGLIVLSLLAIAVVEGQSVEAGPPIITITTSGVRVQTPSATLADTIDALSRAAGFKLSFEGARPTASLFNVDIDTPNLSETLFRLLEGQNLNYAMLFDKSGTKVTSLMILGTAPKGPSSPSTPGNTGGRTGAFSPPRQSRNDLPPVDDDPAEVIEVPAPTPSPTPAPAATPSQRQPFVPFGRSQFGNPLPVQPVPTPSPSA